METDFTKKCRACFSDDQEMYYLFDEFDQGITLQDILMGTSNFTIDKDDGFSPYICHQCTSIIVDFYNFIVVYRENENQIKTILASKPSEDFHDKSNNNLSDATDTDSADQQDNEEGETQMQLELDNDNFVTIKADPDRSGNEDSCDDNYKSKHETFYDESANSSSFSYIQEEAVNVTLDDKNMAPHEYQINTYTCPKCSDCFLYKTDIKEHMISKHNIADANYDDLCELSLMKIEGELRINKCKICQQPFESVEAYRKHLAATHKKNVCDVCGIGFVKKSYLKDHQEIHCTEKRHVCAYCNKAFKRRTVLVKHKRIHTNPRECICELCGKAFNDKGTLKTHITLLHIKSRNYVCLICGDKFPLKATLEKHIRRHDKKEREFFCAQCPLGYKDKSSLDRHIYVKHSGQSMKSTCGDCGRQYTTVSNLFKHQKSCRGAAQGSIAVLYQGRKWASESGEEQEWVDESAKEH